MYIAVEFFKKGDDSVVGWLVSLFDICEARGEMLQDKQNVWILPLY